MKRNTIITLILLFAIVTSCSSTSNRNEEKATYVQDGDTINPLEGSGEGTAGKKYMETKDIGDSTSQVEQDLEVD